MPRLTVLNEKIALEFAFTRAIQIGRHIANSLPLPDREVSRRHAQIFPQDKQYLVSDLGSRNGVYVNGRQVKGEQTLSQGDEICLGMTLLLFDRPEKASITDLLSTRGMRIWDEVDHRREFEITEVTTFSPAELDELIRRWLRREDSPPLVPHRLRSDLLEVALSLGNAATPGELGEVVLDYMHQRLGGDRLAIQVSGPGKRDLKTLACLGEIDEDVRFPKDIVRVALEAQRAIFCPSCSDDFRFRHISKSSDEYLVGSFLAAPIACQGNAYGFLYLDHKLGTGKCDFKAMVQTYLAASLLAKCLHWYHVGLEG
ncbi:FHA domain-containing protein [Candidatus Sumerlaeota bacterium]|nr:FHA domain-containing protein [Candidatus Sumerlaeota bacterium]